MLRARRLHGLRLAEGEFADLQDSLAAPGWLGQDVTSDDRFAGGSLAFASDADVLALVATGRSRLDTA